MILEKSQLVEFSHNNHIWEKLFLFFVIIKANFWISRKTAFRRFPMVFAALSAKIIPASKRIQFMTISLSL
jgi:hypothetical protein